eukprot:jgi/Botrbrau1/12439/Bobra.0094s0008.1
MATTSEGREVDFKKIPLAEAFQILKCTGAGLTTAEARQRREQYGPNQIPETSRNPFIVFLGYMWNPLSWAMEIAAILAIALLDYVDFALIVVLLVLNATISFVEESNADKAIKALTSALAPKAKVKRDGTVTTMAAAELVPGDVIFLQFGNIVPADVKLLGPEGEDDQPLQVDQAALTGESLPVRKFTGDVAFSGSTIKQGEKECLVYATGLNTFFGRAAALIAGTTSVANLQKVMTKIGAYCLVTIAIWVLVELAVQFGGYEHPCRPGAERCPTLSNLLVLIVGGIPIAMPTVLSVTLALGAFKLAKEGAIVARMSAVEEMAAMDILCSDKTGTLTLNKLSIEKASVLVMPGFSLDEVLKLAALSANIVSEEPIDVVLHEAYDAHETLWDNHTSTKYVPFNPVDKYTVNHVKPNDGSRPFRVLKGAPQVVLKHAHNRDEINTVVSSRMWSLRGAASGPLAWPLHQTMVPLLGRPSGSLWRCCRCSTPRATTHRRHHCRVRAHGHPGQDGDGGPASHRQRNCTSAGHGQRSLHHGRPSYTQWRGQRRSRLGPTAFKSWWRRPTALRRSFRSTSSRS